MSHRFRLLSTVVLGATALVASPLAALPAHAAPVDIEIVGINDFHGRLDAAEQLSGTLEELRQENPDILFVAAGDNIGASTFESNVQQDEPTLEVLNAMGLQASALGNHEFDQGYEDIREDGRVDTLADFPYLGANVYEAGTTNPLFDEYVLQEVDGVTIGLVGVVTGETESLVSPAGVENLDFGDPTEAANRVAGELADGDATNGEADVVVLLSHAGSTTGDCETMTEETGEFGQMLNGLTADTDMIVSGHTHDTYACDQITGTTGFSGPVVQAGSYGEYLTRIQFTADPEAGTLTLTGTDLLETAETTTPADPEVTRIVEEAEAYAQEAGAEELGVITEDITRAFTADGQEDRGSESDLGNFIADVQLAQTQEAGADLAFMNPGGLRDDFLVGDQFGSEEAGVVTLGEANAVQPFANGVVTMTLTGEQIEDVLEQQWQPDGASRDFLALGVSDGFFYTYDPEAPRDERITSMTLNGEPIEPGAEYRVTVNSFLADGGDNFTTLAEGTERQQLGITDLEALVAYFEENSPVTPDTEPRRTVAEEDSDGDAPTPQARPTDDSCPAGIPDAGFTDVPDSNPFSDAVDCLRRWGVTRGTTATTYTPAESVTREQMAAFIARLIERSGGTLPEGEDAFDDDNGSAFQADINQLAAAGIVNGTSVRTYSPSLPVTREQMAKFLVLAYDYRAEQGGQAALTADGNYFPDDESSTFTDYIDAAATAGFAAGRQDGTYGPSEPVRRDQMAGFLTRALDLVVENGMATTPAMQ